MAAKPRSVWRVDKGCLRPYDSATVALLRGKGYQVGDIVSADLRKPRNPKFNALAHTFGQMLADNLDAFEGMDGHAVLKRLQIEGAIGCDEMALNFPGIGPCTYRVPRSLAFESMCEAEFSQVYEQFCRYVVKAYWPSMTPEQVAEAGRYYEAMPA